MDRSLLPSGNDIVLLSCLIYSALDILSEWASFSTCCQPVHLWLIASYVLLVVLRLLHYVGNSSCPRTVEGEYLVNLRPKGAVPQFMLYASWLVAIPAFSIWTVTGTIWSWDVWHKSPQCMPAQFLWFGYLWQGISYTWIIAHCLIGFGAVSRERKLRLAEADLRALEDPDTLQRWGALSQIESESTLIPGTSHSGRPGLSPSEIGALSGIKIHTALSHCASEECPICIGEFCGGDTLRQLPNCAHSFHRSCIDLWLLRSATCPLCKTEVERPGLDACTQYSGVIFV